MSSEMSRFDRAHKMISYYRFPQSYIQISFENIEIYISYLYLMPRRR